LAPLELELEGQRDKGRWQGSNAQVLGPQGTHSSCWKHHLGQKEMGKKHLDFSPFPPSRLCWCLPLAKPTRKPKGREPEKCISLETQQVRAEQSRDLRALRKMTGTCRRWPFRLVGQG